jgi:hypothetical protein
MRFDKSVRTEELSKFSNSKKQLNIFWQNETVLIHEVKLVNDLSIQCASSKSKTRNRVYVKSFNSSFNGSDIF